MAAHEAKMDNLKTSPPAKDGQVGASCVICDVNCPMTFHLR